MCSSVNKKVNICHFPWNFHSYMKAIVIAFCRCLSEHIDCSLFVGTYWLFTRETRRRQNASRKSSAVKLSLQTHYNSHYIGKRGADLYLIWALGSAVCCGDCKTLCRMSCIHPVTAKPAPNDNFPATLRTATNSYKYVSLQCNLVAKVILTQFLCSQMCVSINIFFTICRHWSDKRNKKLGHQWMLCAKKTLPCATLNMRAIGSPTLA
jgi:hypothetical protein